MTTAVNPSPIVALDIARNPRELEWLRLFRQIPVDLRAEIAGKMMEIQAMPKRNRAAAMAKYLEGKRHV